MSYLSTVALNLDPIACLLRIWARPISQSARHLDTVTRGASSLAPHTPPAVQVVAATHSDLSRPFLYLLSFPAEAPTSLLKIPSTYIITSTQLNCCSAPYLLFIKLWTVLKYLRIAPRAYQQLKTIVIVNPHSEEKIQSFLTTVNETHSCVNAKKNMKEYGKKPNL